MSILIADAMSQLFCTTIMLILQMNRNGGRSRLHRCHGIKDCIAGCIALRRTCHIRSGLGQDDLCFRHTDPLHCLSCCHRHLNGLWICISHILRCADHNPASNKFNIFPGIQHFRQIKDRRIRIRSPHTLDKCRDRIIMIISAFVIADHFFLNTLRCHLQRNMDLSILTFLCSQNSKLQRI